MNRFFLYLIFASFSFFPDSIYARMLTTFYGDIEVKEQVILDLIESPSMQRLKNVHQYGVSFYTTHKEEYTRFEHTLGVFTVLRAKGASLEEQIAGLLHDISHTVFSHVGDHFIKERRMNESYHENLQEWFLKKYGIEKVLQKHGFSVEQVLVCKEKFPMLEQDLPNLSADRIDYNIQGAYYRGFITKEEALEIFADLQYIEGRWITTKKELIEKIARFALHMTQHCWGSAQNYLTSMWLVEAMLRAKELDLISMEDIYFGTDDAVWNKLRFAKDEVLQKHMHKIMHAEEYFQLAETKTPSMVILQKFRGIDPWVKSDGQIRRLTEICPKVAKEYEDVKRMMKEGHKVVFEDSKEPSLHK